VNPEMTWPLQGNWYNELGSELVIGPPDPVTGAVVGTYQTGVSTGGCAKGVFALAGRSDILFGGQTVGWTVSWFNGPSNCGSTSSWAGNYQDNDGNQTITAFWLLAAHIEPGQGWASTLIGEDVFTRQAPTQEQIASALRRKRHAHP